jgi:hypothetical protein
MEKREIFVKEPPFKKRRKFNTFQRYLENGKEKLQVLWEVFS